MPPGTPTDTPVAKHRPTRHGPGVATDASELLARRVFPASSARSRVASPASHVLIVTEDELLIDGKNGKATRATSETGTPPLGGPASPHDALSSHPATWKSTHGRPWKPCVEDDSAARQKGDPRIVIHREEFSADREHRFGTLREREVPFHCDVRRSLAVVVHGSSSAPDEHSYCSMSPTASGMPLVQANTKHCASERQGRGQSSRAGRWLRAVAQDLSRGSLCFLIIDIYPRLLRPTP